MISFIVIGRNEGWKLSLCFQSILDTINDLDLKKFEILYVDSRSRDDSIERAKKFPEIKVFQITGEFNSAIARNIGANESKGEVLFFIDGDMEIIPAYLPLVYSEKEGLSYDFVSGNWENRYYDENDKLLYSESQYKIDHDIIETTTGGIFLIKRGVWTKNSGMRTAFKKSEDIDFGLRLAKRGIRLFRKKEIAAKHHTINYLSKHRIWKDFFSWNHLYGRSVLYRKNMLNIYMYKRFIRNDYSLIILISVIVTSLLNSYFLIFGSALYLTLQFSKAVLKAGLNIVKSINLFVFLLLRDITVLMGFFVFFPKEKNFHAVDVNQSDYNIWSS